MRMQPKKSRGRRPSWRLAILFAVFFATNTLASGQDVSERPQPLFKPAVISESLKSSPVLSGLKSNTLDKTPRPITVQQGIQWFIASTIGPAHVGGLSFISACGTAVNRPGENGPHWKGFGNRVGISAAGSAAGNAIEVGVGLGLQEDPRYFRASQQGLKYRAGHVARLTFLTRGRDGRVVPAYARYAGILGGNFLSNAWRVPSEATTKGALLRSSEGFAGRMAANAFAECWPDLKKYLLQKRNRAAAR